MKIITFASWKGGTGKTTLLAAFIWILSKMGFKCGIIDIDSNLSLSNIFKSLNNQFTSFELLSGYSGEFINVMENIDIIPSKLEISKMSNLGQFELDFRLKKMDLSSYDFIFIDPPGTMNSLTRNAICASDIIIIPAKPSSIDFKATSLIIDEMLMMKVESDIYIVVNDSDPKTNVPGVFEKYLDEYDDLVYPKKISKMLSLQNLTSNIFEYVLQGRARKNIELLINEVLL